MNYHNFMRCGLIGLLLSGCTPHRVDSDVTPSLSLQSAFPMASQLAIETESVNAQWWLALARPNLSELIEESFKANQDIAAALARLDQARAVRTQSRADLLPQIGAEGRVSETRQKNNTHSSTGEIGGALTWELDAFGRLSAAAKADKLRALARVEDVMALRLSLSAEVANAYFGAVASHKRLQLLNQQLNTDKDLLELIELRQDNGVGTNVEVLQQQSQVAESRSLIPSAEADLRMFENRLDVLLGAEPDGVERVSAEDDLTFIHALSPVGVPADLLLNRPDLRAAQAELVAADADIASAIAARLPQITLTGSYLYRDSATYSGPVASIVGAFVMPLLDWGARKAAVEENKALYAERLANYTQLYLEAVEEVENALYGEKKQREYIQRLHERRQILSDTVEETEALFTQGVTDYLPVLNALQDLRSIERDIITEQQELIYMRITLYRALGGATQTQDEIESLRYDI